MEGTAFGGHSQQYFKGTVTFPAEPFPNYNVCATQIRANGVLLLAAGHTALTVQLYEDSAASFGAVTCIPEHAFYT